MAKKVKRTVWGDINYGVLPVKDKGGGTLGKMVLVRQDKEFLFAINKRGVNIFEGSAKTAGEAMRLSKQILSSHSAGVKAFRKLKG